MTESMGAANRSMADQDRFYVQLDKHPLFQRWGKDDETSPLPTLKDAFIFAACVGWGRERRVPLVKRQHVGFWRTFDSRDSTLLYAIAIAETGDPGVVGDQGEVIRIAEEYANGGIDFLLTYERDHRDRTLVALAGLISEMEPPANRARRPHLLETFGVLIDDDLLDPAPLGDLDDEEA